MKTDGVLQRDEERDKYYTQMKPILDALHDEFITASLESSTIDWDDFFIFYREYKQKLKNRTSFS